MCRCILRRTEAQPRSAVNRSVISSVVVPNHVSAEQKVREITVAEVCRVVRTRKCVGPRAVIVWCRVPVEFLYVRAPPVSSSVKTMCCWPKSWKKHPLQTRRIYLRSKANSTYEWRALVHDKSWVVGCRGLYCQETCSFKILFTEPAAARYHKRAASHIEYFDGRSAADFQSEWVAYKYQNAFQWQLYLSTVVYRKPGQLLAFIYY